MATSLYSWRKAELAVSRVMLPSVWRVEDGYILIYLEEGRVGSLQSDAPILVEGGGSLHLNIPGGRQSWQSPE